MKHNTIYRMRFAICIIPHAHIFRKQWIEFLLGNFMLSMYNETSQRKRKEPGGDEDVIADARTDL